MVPRLSQGLVRENDRNRRVRIIGIQHLQAVTRQKRGFDFHMAGKAPQVKGLGFAARCWVLVLGF